MNSNSNRDRRAIVAAVAFLVTSLTLAGSRSTAQETSPSVRPVLVFAQRVAAQQAIEDLYWRRRVWPKENPGPKPPLSAVIPDDAIRAKVEDYLRKSNALEKWWQRPITAEQLQAELERMSKQTRDPEMLRDLYAALGNDASLIAETLARPTLVDRLIRNGYAADDRFHAALKCQAERALAGSRSVAVMKALGGEYVEQTFVRRRDDRKASAQRPEHGAIELDAEDWKQWTEDLARQFGAVPAALRVQQVSALQEESDRFFVTAVLSMDADQAVVASVIWPKRSFDEWWSEERVGTSVEVEAEAREYALAAPAGAGCVDDTWEERYYAPSGRYSHTAVWTGTEMIVWGGVTNGSDNRGGRYSPTLDNWTPTSAGANVPSMRSEHTAVWTGTEMIVWGGYDLNTGGRYNPTTDSWAATSTGANVPSPRRFATAVWTGTQMIIWGGRGGSVYLNTGARYNPTTNSWIPTSSSALFDAPTGRIAHTAVWTGTEMIIWGGHNSSSYLVAGGRYDPSTNFWTPTSTGANVPALRGYHTSVWTGTAMIVWGGRFGTVELNTGGRYDPSTDSWTATSTGANVPSTRLRHTAVWTGTEMVVWGGIVLNTGGRYDPMTDSWASTSTGANVPSARHLHTAVWTGTEMIVWGGVTTDSGIKGGRYNPAADTWTATSTGAGVPSMRSNHAVVWTGTEMIVWGGGNSNTGGRYNPTTDSWVATSTGANVPSARNFATAVWTGMEMIVWGGLDGATYFGTGGRYDPLSDSWLATSTGANAPVPRFRQTAVWTGSEMIVWGGEDDVVFLLNTGSRYDPTTDSWSATSTENAPSAREFHTAVWTGSEMVVWGGADDVFNVTQTGGRYDPGLDGWTAMSTGSNVPSARSIHTAVWTGAEMIVWGGYSSSDNHFYNSGGRYDPAADTWAEDLVVIPVIERASHTAVWTGSEMIVWGGDTWLGDLNSGARYDPAANSWTATSTGDHVPFPRSHHTAVWTGTTMLVWGGEPLDLSLRLYCASLCSPPAPFESPDLRASKIAGTTLSWTAIPTATGYDVVKGTLSALSSSGGDFATATTACVLDDEPTTNAIVALIPAMGDGFWYLVRPVNRCGAGSYDTGTPHQIGSRDDEIAASGVACP